MTGQNRLNYNIRRSTITSFNSGTGVITLGGAVTGYLGIQNGIAEGQWFTLGVVKGDGSTRFVGAGLYSATSGAGGTPGVTIVNDEDDVSDPFTWIDNTSIIFTTTSALDLNDSRIFFQPTPPSTGGLANQGKLWWDTRSHELYVLYSDGSSTVWISAQGLMGARRTQPADTFLQVGLRRVGGQIADTGQNWAGGSSCRAGDLLVLFAYRDGSTTAPTTPSGYTSITTTAGNTNSMRLCAKIAGSDDESPPATITNATESHFHVFRGHRQAQTGGTVSDSIGSFNGTNGTGTTITVKGLTTVEPAGKALVVAMCGHRSTDVDFGNLDQDMSLVLWGDDNATDASGGWCSSLAIDDFSDKTFNVGGTSSGWASITVEIRAADVIEQNTPGGGNLGDFWAGRRWDGEKYSTTGQSAITACWRGYNGEGGISSSTMTGLCGTGNLSNDDNRTILILEHRLFFDLYPMVVSGQSWSIDGGTNLIRRIVPGDSNRSYLEFFIDDKGGSGPISVIASWTGAEWAYNTQDYAA